MDVITKVIKRKNYYAIFAYIDGVIAGKLYVHDTDLISNLYVRKKYRGNKISKLLFEKLKSEFPGRVFFGYASPKQGNRESLIKYYESIGLIKSGNAKVWYKT